MDTIVFDLDEVLVHNSFWGTLKEYCKTRFKREISLEELGTEYYCANAIFKDDSENIKDFYDYVLEHDVYDHAIIEESTIEILKELCTTHNVVIFTRSTLENNACKSGILFKNKFDFLCKTFPFIPPENFILGSNKSIISAKYMIDDKVDNLSGNIEVKMLYSSKHNLDISDEELYDKGIFRVSSMEEIRKVVYSDYTNAEMIDLIKKYIACASIGNPLLEFSFNWNGEGKGTLKIKIGNGHFVSTKAYIDKLKKLRRFVEGRLGLKVIIEGLP